jgi:hypothetical protein
MYSGTRLYLMIPDVEISASKTVLHLVVADSEPSKDARNV